MLSLRSLEPFASSASCRLNLHPNPLNLCRSVNGFFSNGKGSPVSALASAEHQHKFRGRAADSTCSERVRPGSRSSALAKQGSYGQANLFEHLCVRQYRPSPLLSSRQLGAEVVSSNHQGPLYPLTTAEDADLRQCLAIAQDTRCPTDAVAQQHDC